MSPYFGGQMKTIEFKEAGKWAENDTSLPQLEVEAGDRHLVSDALADIIIGAGRGKIIAPDGSKTEKEKKEQAKPAKKKTPATKDKGKAESK